MGLFVECPGCRSRQHDYTKPCVECGAPLSKKCIFWIEYYTGEGKRKRERIGSSKSLAETILKKRLVQRAENRLLDKKKEDRIRFDDLTKWYLNLAEVKAKRSYERDERSIKKLKAHFGSKLIKEISPASIEAYRQHSLSQINYKKLFNKPATVNREIACLKTIFSKAVENKKVENNPTRAIHQFKENSNRKRVLSLEEWEKYRINCPPWYLPIAMTAYLTGMRRGEIINLSPSRIDLKTGFIRLRQEDTKTGDERSIPIHPELTEILLEVMKVRHLNLDRVFHRNGKSVEESAVREAHERTCEKAEIEDFRFHDFRHTCINNWRLQGHDYFRIMAASGHKTMSVFKGYNTVDDKELKKLVTARMDTPVDTRGETERKTEVGG